MKKANVAIALAMAIELVFVITGSLVSVSPLFAQTNETNEALTYDNISSSGNTAATTTTTTKTPNNNNTFSATGSISSLIYLTGKKTSNSPADIDPLKLTAEKKFSLSGNWSLSVNEGKVTNFATKFSNVLNDGTLWHTHELTNWKAINNTIVRLTPDKSALIAGTVDIKLNGTDIWNNIKTNILITKGKVIAIILDNEAMANHFYGQPIYGVVRSIKDARGNEMLNTQQLQAMQRLH
jgi:hypothetical protein